VDPEKLAHAVNVLKIGQHQRHIFLCPGQACCTKDVGDAAWNALKKECELRGITPGPTPDGLCVARTKAGCLRVCQNGPIALVYPDGTYYAEITADRIPRLVQEHLIEGRPIPEWSFAENPLSHNKPDTSGKPDTSFESD
jgi:(2Fe-2S) ferredoxin